MTKSAIVTGSSRGIGKAIALRLAKDGFAVTINYAGRKDAAEEVVQEITAAGGKAILVQGDVSKNEDIVRLFNETEKAFGGIDVVVNNAGIMALRNIGETDNETFDRLFDINVKGTFLAMREAANRIRKGGRIINFSSTANALLLPRYATYCATKAAVEIYTKTMAKEMRGKEITVNAVAPGPVDTELFWTDKTPEQGEALKKLSPFERLGTPEDIARVVSFLASEDGGWINGQIIRANGGVA
jgi:3-oxoacyl-[acyl-carrier protein] reductase